MTLPVYADPNSRRLLYLLSSNLNFLLSPPFGDSLPGDHIPGVPPVPIPNTAVKPRVANGSRTLGPARVGRCQVYGPVLRKKNRAFFFSGSVVSHPRFADTFRCRRLFAFS